MTSTVTTCQLVCLQKSHDAISLPDGETVVVGRSPNTKITDPRCSRSQLELTADWKRQTVAVKQLGYNPSAVDGKDIGPNNVTTLTMDSTLFMLSGLFPHKVIFQHSQADGAEKQGSGSHVDISKNKKAKDVKKRATSTETEIKVPTSHKKDKLGQKRAVEGKDTDTSGKVSKGSSSSAHASTNHSSTKSFTDSFKRPTSDSHEHPPKKKIKTEESSHLNDSSTRNGAGSTSHKTSNQQKSAGHSSHKESSRRSLSEHKTKNEADRSDDLEPDEEEHLAEVEAKLNKMKQDVQSVSKQTKSEEKPCPQSTVRRDSSGSSSGESSLNAKTSLPITQSEKASWDYHVDHYVFTSKGVTPRRQIAGFDLDGTIIVTRSGKKFPEDADDWKICMPEVYGKLKCLHAENFKIVFFTNQLGVARGKTKIEDLMKKVENVISKVQVPVQVFIATHEGRYRKPMTGMWELLQKQYNGGVKIDRKSSIYVGDAAGRQENWAPRKKKDFSCSDRLFALNIGVPFKTPEEFFQNQKATSLFKLPEFDPRKLSSSGELLSKGSKLASGSKEVIILVGFPACGKSHFATKVLAPKGYAVINRDTLGKWQKCVKQAKEALVKSSVVVDNTNLSIEERARYIDCAKKSGVSCRCFVFTTTIEHCRHNERFRQMTSKSHQKINEMIFNQIKKKYEEPSMSEGFTEIVNVNFVPNFSSKKEETYYRYFLLEK